MNCKTNNENWADLKIVMRELYSPAWRIDQTSSREAANWVWMESKENVLFDSSFSLDEAEESRHAKRVKYRIR